MNSTGHHQTCKAIKKQTIETFNNPMFPSYEYEKKSKRLWIINKHYVKNFIAHKKWHYIHI